MRNQSDLTNYSCHSILIEIPKRPNVFERFRDSQRNKRRYVGTDKSSRFSPYADSFYKDVRDGIAGKKTERKKEIPNGSNIPRRSKTFPPIYRYLRYDIIFTVILYDRRDRKRLVLFHRASVASNKSKINESMATIRKPMLLNSLLTRSNYRSIIVFVRNHFEMIF